MNWTALIIFGVLVILIIITLRSSKVNGEGSPREKRLIQRRKTSDKNRLRHEIRRFNAKIDSEIEILKERKKNETEIQQELKIKFNDLLREINTDLVRAGYDSEQKIRGLLGTSEYKQFKRNRKIIE